MRRPKGGETANIFSFWLPVGKLLAIVNCMWCVCVGRGIIGGIYSAWREREGTADSLALHGAARLETSRGERRLFYKIGNVRFGTWWRAAGGRKIR